MKKIILIALLIFPIPLFSENEIPDQQGDFQLDNPPSLEEIIDYNKSNNSENGFSMHKQNYLLPVDITSHYKGRKRSEVKFQFGFKQRLLRFYGWAWFFGYSQKSFWQAYDFHDSRPFRENNFNPEMFIRTSMLFGIRSDFGFEHESNGLGLPNSRGWNRVYVSPYFENKYVASNLKIWYRIPERKKTSPTDAVGDDNPDIYRYYGYSELTMTAKVHIFNVTTLVRYNPIYNHGALEINLTVPMSTNSMSWMVQYWYGYGESLIDYNVLQQKIGFGVNFSK